MGTIRIGISGWRYEPWRGVFYPKGHAQRRELEFASRAFPTIEINGSFYSLQHPASYQTWYDATPPGFVFAIKGGRYITHMLRLKNCERAMANFFASGIFNLREKIGPFLWQFPPQFHYDAERFENFFRSLPRDLESALSLARRRDVRMTGRCRLGIDCNRPLRGHALALRTTGPGRQDADTAHTESCMNERPSRAGARRSRYCAAWAYARGPRSTKSVSRAKGCAATRAKRGRITASTGSNRTSSRGSRCGSPRSKIQEALIKSSN